MPNIVKRRGRNKAFTSCRQVEDALVEALGGDISCVGVMIQAGKTLTNLRNWKRTAGGGHVSPFVYDVNRGLFSWDEVTDTSWQTMAVHSRVSRQWGRGNPLFKRSRTNDVTIYLHRATDQQLNAVRGRAERLVTHGSLKYSHRPTFGYGLPRSGDCVTKTAWVIGAFSYSVPMHTATPWGQAVMYEFYTSRANLISKWFKVKYIDRKLMVM